MQPPPVKPALQLKNEDRRQKNEEKALHKEISAI
jgi:hypothetical protein